MQNWTNIREKGSTLPDAAEGAAGVALFVGSEFADVGFAFGIDSLSILKRPSSSIIFVLWCCAFLYLLRSVPRGGGGGCTQ